jgi:hypothetical protein
VTLLLLMLAMPVHAAAMSDDSLCNLAGLYLALLDQGRGEEAWQQMSEITRLLIDQDRWLNQQQAIRSAYGSCLSREFYRIDHRQSYNLSPDGHYVVVQDKSRFQNKQDNMETVVLDCHMGPDCSIRA